VSGVSNQSNDVVIGGGVTAVRQVSNPQKYDVVLETEPRIK